jgi:hypothetical protein
MASGENPPSARASSRIEPLPMGLGMVMGPEIDVPALGHQFAPNGCPLHSAAWTDRFRLLLGEVAAPEAGAAALVRRGN